MDSGGIGAAAAGQQEKKLPAKRRGRPPKRKEQRDPQVSVCIELSFGKYRISF